jgi:hypothetical protein
MVFLLVFSFLFQFDVCFSYFSHLNCILFDVMEIEGEYIVK